MTLTIEKTIRNKQDFIRECSDWCKTFRNENNVIIKYIRKGTAPVCLTETENGFSVKVGKSKPVGVLAAYRGADGVVRIGWSLCRRTEPFNPKVGLRYALERAVSEGVMVSLGMSISQFRKGRFSRMPKSIEKEMKEFIERTKRYFKT